MKISNLIPITRIYDIYPKYTYSEDVKKFMDEIVDIDRANVYTKNEVIDILTELQQKIEENVLADDPNTLLSFLQVRESCVAVIQQKINDVEE